MSRPQLPDPAGMPKLPASTAGNKELQARYRSTARIVAAEGYDIGCMTWQDIEGCYKEIRARDRRYTK